MADSWTPKSLAEIPLIIAGPILRKVTKNEVSVWMILKNPTTVKLNIYSPDFVDPIIESSVVSPTKLGSNFYVTCVTAKSDVHNMNEDYTYGYNLIFDGISDLNTAGILKVGASGLDLITYSGSPTYGGVKLPTFVLPKSSFNELRIVHGSCRKPHGERYDGLPALNRLIEETIDSDVFKRPQMLFLTGDQIYADDVADALLHAIVGSYDEEEGGGYTKVTDGYRDLLFGWEETFPGVTLGNKNLWPGNRDHYIVDTIEFQNSDKDTTKSHLMRFDEYMLMYALVWSPTLWKPDSFPTFSDVYRTPAFYEDDVWTGYAYETRTKEDERNGPFMKELGHLQRFYQTLPEVRKLLANIPTYMTLDDHEVTDDLFITAKWTDHILGNGLSKRILQNGLAAFSICQVWGNAPDQFAVGEPGEILLNHFETIAENNNTGNDVLWNTSIRNIVLPYLDETVSGEVWELKRYAGALKYHWHYQSSAFEVICLDGRTRRIFRQGYAEECGNLSDDAINEQIKNLPGPKKSLSFVISGAPIFGVEAIEDLIQLADWFKSIPYLDLESWNLDLRTRQGVLSAFASRSQSTSNRKHKVVVLSGDVHYGFTNNIKYKANSTYLYDYSNVELSVVQCCASSLKNEKGEGMTTTRYQHKRVLNKKSDKIEVWGYNNHSESSVPITVVQTHDTEPDISRLIGNSDSSPILVPNYQTYSPLPGYTASLVPAEDWSLTMHPVRSEFISGTVVSVGPLNTFKKYIDASGEHRYNYYYNKDDGAYTKYGRYIAGVNNFGDIEFEYSVGEENILHKLWWRNLAIDSDDDPLDGFPLTIHKVDMKIS